MSIHTCNSFCFPFLFFCFFLNLILYLRILSQSCTQWKIDFIRFYISVYRYTYTHTHTSAQHICTNILTYTHVYIYMYLFFFAWSLIVIELYSTVSLQLFIFKWTLTSNWASQDFTIYVRGGIYIIYAHTLKKYRRCTSEHIRYLTNYEGAYTRRNTRCISAE